MKIYQLHEHGGEWEDSFDYIVGSYLRKERAEEEKAKREAEEKEEIKLSQKCLECPCLEYPIANDNRKNKVIKRCEKYCKKFKYVDLGWNNFRCANYTTHWYESHFEIKEVEVEE